MNWSDGTTANPRTDRNVTARCQRDSELRRRRPVLADLHRKRRRDSLRGYLADASRVVTTAPRSRPTRTRATTSSSGATDVTDNPRTDTNVTADVTATAVFAVDTYTLDYAADAGGTIEGDAHQTVDCGASGSEVRAVPDSCHDFAGWSDGSPTTHAPTPT